MKNLLILYSRIRCHLNIYPKYGMSGRCMWCGVKHGMHLRSTEVPIGELIKKVKEIKGVE